MTQSHKPDATDNTKPASPANDNTAVQQALHDDLQGKYFPGAAKPENITKLITDGILPAGATVIDMSAVKDHLTADQQKLAELNGKQPTDVAPATKALTDAQGVQTQAQQTLDAAEAKIKPITDKIDARNQQDAQVKADFDTVTKATGDTWERASDLKAIQNDASKPQEVRDAAGRLLATFQDHPAGTGRGRTNNVTNDYGKVGVLNPMYLDKDTIEAGIQHHQELNAADQKTLAPLVADRDQAKAAKDTADAGVTTAQKNLDSVNAGNKDLADQKTQTADRIKEEQAALTPDAAADKAGRVVRGGGYYQVAENLLGISDKARHTTMQEKELKLLTKMLQDEERTLNGGHLPKYLKENDVLLKPENIQSVIDRLKAK
jgi:hypothetical protein